MPGSSRGLPECSGAAAAEGTRARASLKRRCAPRAVPHAGSFTVGEAHPHGLRLHFDVREDGVRAEWTAPAEFQGFLGIVHGGVVSTVLDEAMSQAVIAERREALTAELRVRFRRALTPGEHIHVRGWVERQNRRSVQTEACICDDAGDEIAHAWATFLAVGPSYDCRPAKSRDGGMV